MERRVLAAAERGFLNLVAQAVFTNPFSDERGAVDLAISGLSGNVAAEQRLATALARVRDFLDKLARQGQAAPSSYGGEDRELVEGAHLFVIYHQFRERFDGLIRAQLQSDESLCVVPFAAEALDLLRSRGIGAADAVRYFAMFYQLRRAYYFIDLALVGRSPSMKQFRRALWNNVFTHDIRLYARHLWNRMEDFSTLLLGETGTGKGAAAAAIGQSGFIPFDMKRSVFAESFTRTFHPINLSQFAEGLIESELFGHRKGAFTGAVEAHEGIFARCSPHGAIFLDEIGDVGVPVQIKLLKVLQDREFCPAGSHDRRRFYGRVIAASNKSIDDLRREGLFRDDFFYRLCSDVITVPPLRQRLSEEPRELDDRVGVVVRRTVGAEARAVAEFVCAVIRKGVGSAYAWTGNVRELEQCVRRILLTRAYEGDLRSTGRDLQRRIVEGVQAGDISAQELLAGYCALLHGRHGTYEAVARRTGLDRRTAKKYVEEGRSRQQ